MHDVLGRSDGCFRLLPAMSTKATEAVSQKIRAWHLNRRSDTGLADLEGGLPPFTVACATSPCRDTVRTVATAPATTISRLGWPLNFGFRLRGVYRVEDSDHHADTWGAADGLSSSGAALRALGLDGEAPDGKPARSRDSSSP